MTENDKSRLSSIMQVWNETKRVENMHPDFVKDVDWVIWEARSKHNIQEENEEITGLMVKMRETFTERDQQAEGHGMEDVISCPIAVAQYAFNKLERTIDENKRLEKAVYVVFAHAVDSQANGIIDVITDTLQGLDFTEFWNADCEKGKKLFEEWMK